MSEPLNLLGVFSELARIDLAGQLNNRHIRLLAHVCMAADNTAGGIARSLGITPGAVTRTSGRLVDAGLLERIHGDTDRREVRFAATPSGWTLHARIHAALARFTS